MKLIDILTGEIQTYSRKGEPFSSAYAKRSQPGPAQIRATGIAGDAQADRSCHGGEDKAVLCCSLGHYERLRTAGLPAESQGLFGENLLWSDGGEDAVHIGDRYVIGSVLVEVSQPRQPCWKVAEIYSKALLQFMVKEAATGWYCRVLREGELNQNDSISRVEQGSDYTVLEATRMLQNPKRHDQQRIEGILQLATVAESYRIDLEKKIR